MPHSWKDESNRAEKALHALQTQYECAPLRDGVVDALTDLRHLCREYGINWYDVDKIAREHFNAELAAKD
jgi:hypothetical protein